METEQQDIHLAGTTLHQHRHLCALFQSREERYRVLGPFVKEGIERGEKAYHVVDPAERVNHLHRLHAAGIDVRSNRGSRSSRIARSYTSPAATMADAFTSSSTMRS